MKKKSEEPSIVIGTEDEAYWTKIREQTENSLKEAKEKVKFLEGVLEHSNRRIEEEKKSS